MEKSFRQPPDQQPVVVVGVEAVGASVWVRSPADWTVAMSGEAHWCCMSLTSDLIYLICLAIEPEQPEYFPHSFEEDVGDCADER